jgi:hypothetical protein
MKTIRESNGFAHRRSLRRGRLRFRQFGVRISDYQYGAPIERIEEALADRAVLWRAIGNRRVGGLAFPPV